MNSPLPETPFQAVVLDLDGTLLDDSGIAPPRTLAALREAESRGVRVMVATGRSEASAGPVLESLGFETPAVLYNGAAVYCPRRRGLIEERLFPQDALERVLAFAEARGYLPVVMRAGAKFALAPRTAAERLALADMKHLHIVPPEELRADRTIRVSLLSHEHENGDAFRDDFQKDVTDDLFVTHFPLRLLPAHRQSPLVVMDVQPPCAGKAEALRFLHRVHDVPASRVVAVGDAPNDLEMLHAAGLSVAMGNAVPEVKSVAHRVIGECGTDAIGELVEEIFLGPPASRSLPG